MKLQKSQIKINRINYLNFVIINRNWKKKYNSNAEASRETGCSSQSIRDAAKGIREQAGGFFWGYQEDIEKDDEK
jgi:hypothetical protein